MPYKDLDSVRWIGEGTTPTERTRFEISLEAANRYGRHAGAAAMSMLREPAVDVHDVEFDVEVFLAEVAAEMQARKIKLRSWTWSSALLLIYSIAEIGLAI